MLERAVYIKYHLSSVPEEVKYQESLHICSEAVREYQMQHLPCLRSPSWGHVNGGCGKSGCV